MLGESEVKQFRAVTTSFGAGGHRPEGTGVACFIDTDWKAEACAVALTKTEGRGTTWDFDYDNYDGTTEIRLVPVTDH